MSTCPTCNKTDCDELVRCDICRKKAFCGDECRTMGWSIHEGVCNVITVPKRDMTVMVPYYGEDTMDAEVLDKLPKSSELFQSHIVRYVDPKGIVEQHVVIGGCLEPVVQETLGKGGGDYLDKEQLEMTYVIKVEHHWEDTIDGSILYDGIYKVKDTIISNNSGNDKLRRIAKRNFFPSSAIVLNPTAKTRPDSRGGAIESRGAIRVTVIINGVQQVVDAHYDLDKYMNTKTKEVLRNVRRIFQKNQAAGIKELPYPIQHLLFMKARNTFDGTLVLFTFKVDKTGGSKLIELVDLEIGLRSSLFKPPTQQNPGTSPTPPAQGSDWDEAPTPPPPTDDLKNAQVRSKYPFRCDPSSLEHVTALVMAMEDWMGHGELQSASVQAHFDTINTYRHTMEEALLRGDDPQAPSPKINAAINSATQEVWELVEARGRERSPWRRKLATKGYSLKKGAKVMSGNARLLKKVREDLKKGNYKAAVDALRDQIDFFDKQKTRGAQGDQIAKTISDIYIELIVPDRVSMHNKYRSTLKTDDDVKTVGTQKEFDRLMERAANIHKEIGGGGENEEQP